MSRTRDQAGLLLARRFLAELKGINHQMTLTEAIILIDVATAESGFETSGLQPAVGMPMHTIHQQHFSGKSRQQMSRALKTMETGFDPRGHGDGVQLIEVFTPVDAKDKRTKAVRLKPAAREHLNSALRKAFPSIYKDAVHGQQHDRERQDQPDDPASHSCGEKNQAAEGPNT